MARRVAAPPARWILRSQAILRAVIEEYVDTATPVGSLRSSSATASACRARPCATSSPDLESAGLLTHPHTSRRPRPDRRRLPLLRGVDRRVGSPAAGRAADDPAPVRPGPARQRAVVPARRDDPRRRQPDRRRSSRRPSPRTAHVRRIDIVSISDRLASLIIVFREGAVRQVARQPARCDRAGGPDPGRRRPRRDHGRADRRRRRAALARIDADRAHRRPGRSRSASASSPPSATTTRRRSRRSSATACSRDGRARVRPERQAPPGLRGAREPRLSRRPRRRVAGSGEVRVVHRRRERPRGDARRLAGPRLVRASRAGPSAWSASSGRRAWPIRQAIGTVRFVSGLMNELVAHIHA